jgi:hypothetical protein
VDLATLAAGDRFHRLHRFVYAAQSHSGLIEKDAPGLGKPHRLCAVLEQSYAKLIL